MIYLTLDDRWLNDIQKETIRKMLDRCRHGAQFIDVHIRRDAAETHHEADWIKHLEIVEKPQ